MSDKCIFRENKADIGRNHIAGGKPYHISGNDVFDGNFRLHAITQMCIRDRDLGVGLLKNPFVIQEGYIDVPKGPGLGIDVDEYAVKPSSTLFFTQYCSSSLEGSSLKGTAWAVSYTHLDVYKRQSLDTVACFRRQSSGAALWTIALTFPSFGSLTAPSLSLIHIYWDLQPQTASLPLP